MQIVNYIIIALICIGVIIALRIILNKDFSNIEKDRMLDAIDEDGRYEISAIVEYIKESINEITRTNLYDMGLSPEEFKRRLNKRSELKKALKGCLYGAIEDKQYVKDFIYDLIKKSYIDESNICKVIPFDNPHRMSILDKFDVLIYYFKKKYGYDSLTRIILKYKLDEPKQVIEDGSIPSYIITDEEIENIYREERVTLGFNDRLQVIVQRVYQLYKGYSVIDEIRDMNIDGVSGGVSGITNVLNTPGSDYSSVDHYISQIKSVPKTYDSIWIFFKGKSINLSFLTFGTERELRRVCQNIYRNNRAGQLSENIGYKINEMKDGSRVVVLRPGFSESWAFFVRKFHITNVTLEDLIRDENAALPIQVIKFLAKGCRITSITGSQGCGKTTLLMAMVRHIYATLTLRIQEMAFELHLRRIYPMRNILSFRETDTITGQEGLDVQKKTDGSVNILGEVATDPVAAWMIQMAQVASLFTIFTHHAKTVKDLVYSLRNSLLKCEVFNNEKVAEQQVVSVLNFDIHLVRDYSGKRYIERITEIIEIEQDIPYSKAYNGIQGGDQQTLFMDTVVEYFTRVTDRKVFEGRNIIEYRDGRYVAVNSISEKSIREMRNHMTSRDRQEFDEFLKSWRDAS